MISQATEAAAMDVHLYLDSNYYGSFPIDRIEAYFSRYEQNAELIRNMLDWDEVLLYAVYVYSKDNEMLLSAEFMLMRIRYDRFAKLCSTLSDNCRLFFKRNK